MHGRPELELGMGAPRMPAWTKPQEPCKPQALVKRPKLPCLQPTSTLLNHATMIISPWVMEALRSTGWGWCVKVESDQLHV